MLAGKGSRQGSLRFEEETTPMIDSVEATMTDSLMRCES